MQKAAWCLLEFHCNNDEAVEEKNNFLLNCIRWECYYVIWILGINLFLTKIVHQYNIWRNKKDGGKWRGQNTRNYKKIRHYKICLVFHYILYIYHICHVVRLTNNIENTLTHFGRQIFSLLPQIKTRSFLATKGLKLKITFRQFTTFSIFCNLNAGSIT